MYSVYIEHVLATNLSNLGLSLVFESCCPCTPVGCDGNVGVRPSHDKTRNEKTKDHHRPEVRVRSRGPVQSTGRKIFCNDYIHNKR